MTGSEPAGECFMQVTKSQSQTTRASSLCVEPTRERRQAEGLQRGRSWSTTGRRPLRQRFSGIGRGLAVVLVGMALATGTAWAGAVMLAGHDADDHDLETVYASLFDDVMKKVSNDGTGILAIGAYPGSRAGNWIQTVARLLDPPQPVVFVNDTAILDVDFSGFAMLHIPSDSADTSGGITVTENGYLAQRSGAIAVFVNGGGGIFVLTQADLPNAYEWLAPLGSLVTLDVGPGGSLPSGKGFDNVSATQEGRALGIDDTNLDGCCWHNVFTSFPSFMEVLAVANEPADPAFDGQATILGGKDLELPTVTLSLEVSEDVVDVLNEEGWYEENPVRATLTATCNDPVLPCLGSLIFDIGDPVNPPDPTSGRFYVTGASARDDFLLECFEDDFAEFCQTTRGLQTTASGNGRNPNLEYSLLDYRMFVDSISPLGIEIAPGDSIEFTWDLWVQPQPASTIEMDAEWFDVVSGVTSTASGSFSVEPAAIHPAVFVHGILGSMPPADSVVSEWPQLFSKSKPSSDPHLDPFIGSYKPLIDNLLRMGYELGTTLIPVTYDWRQSNVESAAWLAQVLDQYIGRPGSPADDLTSLDHVVADGTADVVVHSMGGLVLRTYIAGLAANGDPVDPATTSYPYRQNVRKAVFIATPHRGFPFDYNTWQGQTWQDYFDGQAGDVLLGGQVAVWLLQYATDALLWPALVLDRYGPVKNVDACWGWLHTFKLVAKEEVIDRLEFLGCDPQILHDYAHADPFDATHPGIGSLREMLPEEGFDYLRDASSGSPFPLGREPNYLLEVLGLNSSPLLETLTEVGPLPGIYDNIYVLYNSEWNTVSAYDATEPDPLPGPISLQGKPKTYTPTSRRWMPGGEISNPRTNPGQRVGSGDNLIPMYSTAPFYSGLFDSTGVNVVDQEIEIPGVDHVLIAGDLRTQSVIGAILSGMLLPSEAAANPELFPLQSEFQAPVLLVDNFDVIAALLKQAFKLK